MKVNNKSLILLFLAFWMAAFGSTLQAQTDDVYYDPSTDAPPPADYQTTTDPANVSRGYDDGDGQYDDETYTYDDDYAYEYSSRLRRFHRPVVVYDYYDPFFTDLWVYDPYYLPGASIYVIGGDDYYTYRRWNRWNHHNHWNAWGGYDPYGGYGWNSWGYGGGYNNWNVWSNPYVCNNYYYDPYWTWNGYNPYYNNNVWVNNNYYYDNNSGHHNGGGYSPQTYTGPRRHGSSVNPGYVQIKDKNGRLNPDGKAPAVVELNGRQPGRIPVESDREPVSKGDKVIGRQANAPTDAVKSPQTGRTNSPAGKPQDTRPTDMRPTQQQPGRQTQDTRPTEPQRRPTDATREPQSRPTDTRPQREPQQQQQRDTRPQREEPRPSRRSYDQPREEARPQRETPSPSNQRREETRPTRNTEPQQRTMERPTRSSDSGNNSSGGSTKSSGNSGSGGSTTKSTSGRGGRN